MSKQLISTGVGVPTSTPTFEGEIYVDTTNDNTYMAKGVASSADWVQTNGVASVWVSGGALVINNGGTLTYDTEYNRYYELGDILNWEFRATQTNAGSGTSDITIDPPAGITLTDGDMGVCTMADMANDNQVQSVPCIVVSNQIKIYNPVAGLLFLRGGNFIGNNGVVFIAVSFSRTSA